MPNVNVTDWPLPSVVNGAKPLAVTHIALEIPELQLPFPLFDFPASNV